LSHILTLILSMLSAQFGHVDPDRRSRLVKEGLLNRFVVVKLSMCEPCLTGETTIKPFRKVISFIFA